MIITGSSGNEIFGGVSAGISLIFVGVIGGISPGTPTPKSGTTIALQR